MLFIPTLLTKAFVLPALECKLRHCLLWRRYMFVHGCVHSFVSISKNPLMQIVMLMVEESIRRTLSTGSLKRESGWNCSSVDNHIASLYSPWLWEGRAVYCSTISSLRRPPSFPLTSLRGILNGYIQSTLLPSLPTSTSLSIPSVCFCFRNKFSYF